MEKNNYAELVATLKFLKKKVEKTPEVVSKEVGGIVKEEVYNQLKIQSEDKVPPPLSAATHKIRENNEGREKANLHEKIKIKRSHTVHGFKVEIEFDEDVKQIASTQEKGAMIPVSDKMRGFLATKGIFLKKETTFIIVPGRKFFTKAIKKAKKRVKAEILKKITK